MYIAIFPSPGVFSDSGCCLPWWQKLLMSSVEQATGIHTSKHYELLHCESSEGLWLPSASEGFEILRARAPGVLFSAEHWRPRWHLLCG